MPTRAPPSARCLAALAALLAGAPALATGPAATAPGKGKAAARPAAPPAPLPPAFPDLPPAAIKLAARLAVDSATLEREHVRPVHRGAAAPGSLGDALASHLPAFEAVARPGGQEGAGLDGWWELASGRRDARALTDDEARAVGRLLPHLEPILDGTRAGRADLAPADDPMQPAPGATWSGFQLAVALTGLRTRQQLEVGDPAAAVHTCLDGLALLRDASIAGGLVGSMVAAAGVERLSGTCAAAIDAAPAAVQRDALASLRAIRAALPSLQEVFRVEGLQMELLVFGKLAGPALRQRVGQSARRWIDAGGSTPAPAGEEARHRKSAEWIRARAGWDQLVRAGLLEPAERPAAIAAGRRLLQTATGKEDEGEPTFEGYAGRFDATRRRLDALSLATAAHLYRQERGTWPMNARALAAWLPPGSAERSAAAGADLEPSLELRSLEIRVPPPPGAHSDETPVFAIASVR